MKLYKPLLLLLNNFYLLIDGMATIPQDLTHGNVGRIEGYIYPYQVSEQVSQPQSNIVYGYQGLEDSFQPDLLDHLYAIENHLMDNSNFPGSQVGLQTQPQDIHRVQDQGLDSSFSGESYSHKTRDKKRKNSSNHIYSKYVGPYTTRKDKQSKFNPDMCQSSFVDWSSSLNTQGLPGEINEVDLSKEAEESKLLDILQEKGSFALQENQSLDRKVEDDYGTLLESIVARYGYGRNCGLDIKNLLESVHKLKTDVITRYFGGMIVMFHDVQAGPPSNELLNDGWKILYQELNRVIFTPYNEFYNLAGTKIGSKSHRKIENLLLEDILNLRLKYTMLSSIVFNLIKIWAKQTAYSPHYYGIDLESFQSLNLLLSKGNV
ncbi:hypothetical protein DFH28DRAFT_975097 [Melampsora americana]|nr:hypothetical protein DFH28DRAFT_975097 [Melampsora americana]